MNNKNINMDTQNDKQDIDMSQQGTKSTRIDRSHSKYSENSFMKLASAEQIELLNKYLIEIPSKDFDDGTFQFSRSHLVTLSERLGFKKGFIDTGENKTEYTMNESSFLNKTLYIEHGKRGNTINKKITLNVETANKINEFFNGMSNLEKSKIFDSILNEIFTHLKNKKGNGFKVAYKATKEKVLLD